MRIHLDDCPAANGPLRVIPGSHLAGKLGESAIAGIAVEHEAVVCEVAAGGALLMRPLLIHSSSAAVTPQHRRVIHLDYANISLPEGLFWFEREAKVLARNIVGVLDGLPPEPFVYSTLGMMGSLGHGKAFGQLLKVRVRGFLAWFVRRTYYLLQMPGWRRRLRIMIDWTFALLFRPDVVKISL